MIYTVTYNPAIDETFLVSNTNTTEPNKILHHKLDPAGKGINVSKVISSSHVPSIAVSFVGGDNGKLLKSLLEDQQVPYYFFSIQDNIRKNIKIMNKQDHSVMEFNEVGPYLLKEKQEELYTYFDERLEQGDIVILSGSVPNGCDEFTYYNFIKRYTNKDLTFILDASTKLLEEGIKAKPTIIKPNIHELQAITNKSLTTESEIIVEAKKLLQKGIKEIIVSRGEHGALYISNNEIYSISVPPITSPHTVGAGDAFVGGYAVCLERNDPLVKRLKYASATAIASILQVGTTPGTNDDINRLYKQITISKI